MKPLFQTAAPSHSIVCGVDDSQNADAIASFAADLAERIGNKLLLLNATPSPWVSDRPAATYRERRRDAESFERAGQMQVVFGGIEVAAEPGIACAVEFGQPSDVLTAAAAVLESPFLVVGDKELTGLDRMVLGSAAEAVIGKSPCPVVVFPSGPVPTSGSTLVCGVDRSRSALAVTAVAARLAQQLGLKLVLVHALEGGAGEAASFELELKIARDHAPSQPTELIAEPGSPKDILARVGRDLGAEMIVIGSRGLGMVRRALLGSVSTALLKESHDRPVVVVPSGIGEEAAGG